MTRDEWFRWMIEGFTPIFAERELILPRVRFSSVAEGASCTGWQMRCLRYVQRDHAGAVIGVSASIRDEMEAAAAVAHQLIHLAVGIDDRHGPKFRAAAVALGLVGPMRELKAGIEFVPLARSIINELGKLPRPPAEILPRRKRRNPYITVACSVCGYPAQVTAIWLNGSGAPQCPQGHGTLQRRAASNASRNTV